MKTERTVCFTGHRHISACDEYDLKELLCEEIEEQILRNAKFFRTGGAIGFDTLAALAVLEQKATHPDIRLELILPCPSQTEKWSKRDVDLYKHILASADSHRYVSPYYYSGLLQQRNRALVEGADACIAYLNSSHGGGTAYTSALAIRSGLEYVNLAERVGWRI